MFSCLCKTQLSTCVIIISSNRLSPTMGVFGYSFSRGVGFLGVVSHLKYDKVGNLKLENHGLCS